MSKHPRVPGPVPKVFPSIIRTAGARALLLTAGCAALLVLGGGGYLLSHSKLNVQPPTNASTDKKKVLGSTTQKATDTQATPTTQGAPAPISPAPAATPTPSTTKKQTEALGFDIVISTSKIHRQGLAVYIPFSVKRHGGLTTPIVPGNISVTSGGLLANVTIQSEVMITPDTGVIILLPLNLGSNVLNVHFSASSGNTIASTNFIYRLAAH